MTADDATRGTARFGPYALDFQHAQLRRNGKLLRLQEKPLKLLIALLDRPGETVSREELRLRLWPSESFGSFDAGLNTAVRKLRRTLGDLAAQPQFIETIPRQGYRFIGPVRTSAGTDVQSSSRHRRWLAGLAIVFATSGALAVHRWLAWSRPISSVVVLPLQQMSGDANEAWFADGLTDALTTDLAQIRSIRVASRTSAMQYKGRRIPLASIRAQLGVDAVVEGTVTRWGHRVRITARLIDARNDRHLWAQTYERDMTDIIRVQQAVAGTIADQIGASLSNAERARLRNARAVDPEAYDDYLRGRFYWNRYTPEGFQRSVECFRRAITRDPTFALAYAGLADSYLLLGTYEIKLPRLTMPPGVAAAQRALELDPTLAQAHYSLAFAKMEYEYDWIGAEQEFRKGVDLNPNYAIGRMWHSLLFSLLSRHDDAIREQLAARMLDPVSLIINTNLCRAYILAKRPDEAIAECKQTLQLDPHFSLAEKWLSTAYEQKGMFAEAAAAYERALLLDHQGDDAHAVASAFSAGGRSALLEVIARQNTERFAATQCDATRVARAYANLGSKDKAFMYLDKAYEDRAAALTLVAVQPQFQSLRSDARFSALLRRMQLTNSSMMSP